MRNQKVTPIDSELLNYRHFLYFYLIIMGGKTVSDKQLETIIEGFRKEFRLFREEYQKGFDELKSNFQEEMKKRDEAISVLKQENKTLQDYVARLEEKIDDAEAYERRDCVVLSGDGVPAAQTGENCIQVACDLIKDKLKLNISPSEVSTAHRLGKKPSAPKDNLKIMPPPSQNS